MPPRVEDEPTQTNRPLPRARRCGSAARLIRGEGFGRAEHHVAGIVDDDIEAAGVIQDVRDAGLGRAVGLDIQFDSAQV